MKTLKQIESKIRLLKTRLIRKWNKSGGYENFGDAEVRTLEGFCGDVYGYPLDIRCNIQNLVHSFFDWTINYTG